MLLPSIEASGPSGGVVMTRVTPRMSVYFGALSGITVLTGIYLLWRFTGGFDPAVLVTRAGWAFSVGGTAGILAAIVGGVVGKTTATLITAGASLASATEGPARNALMRQVAALRQRLKALGRAVIVLQAIALILMALGHYV